MHKPKLLSEENLEKNLHYHYNNASVFIIVNDKTWLVWDM